MTRQLDGLQNVDPADRRRRDLMRLVEVYAIRARKLSDAVATLGSHISAESPFEAIVIDIKKLQILCEEAAGDLFARIEPERAPRSASVGAGTETQPESPSD